MNRKNWIECEFVIGCSQTHGGTLHSKPGLNVVRQVTGRPALTTRPSSALQLNNSCILHSTSLLADPEVFLMLLHNSVWFCIATLRVSLYVTGEGYFSERTGGHDGLALAPVPLSWLAGPAWMFAWGGGWRVLTDVDGGMMDWCFSGWMIDKVVGMGGKRQSSRECGSRGPQARHSGANPGRAWLSLLQLCLRAFPNSLFGFLLAASTFCLKVLPVFISQITFVETLCIQNLFDMRLPNKI